MKNVSVDKIIYSLEEHRQLFKILGYELDVIKGEIPLHEVIKIYKNDKIIGTITHKEKNMYWLKEKNEILVNENINNMHFHQVPKYNKKSVFHIIIDDDKFRVNCYNIFNKNYIGLENKKIKIKKFKDMIKIEIKKDENHNGFNIIYPNREDSNEVYSEILNKVFGYDVISNIESYYNNVKKHVKQK